MTKKKPKMELNEGHWHEICHTSNIIAEMIDTHLVGAYEGGDLVMTARAEAARDILCEIYQYAGRRL